MTLRFDDHARFQRTCLVAAAGAGIAAAVAGALGSSLVAHAQMGAMLALVPLRVGGSARWRAGAAVVCAVAGAGSAMLGSGPALAAALFALGAALSCERELPPPACIAAACALAAAAGWAAAAIPPLAQVIAAGMPAHGAAALGGAVLGLWLGTACAPLHLRFDLDRVEARFAAVRDSLPPDLRQLARRAVAARRESLRAGPVALRGDLRRLLDGLALAALDLARRGADLSRGASPDVEQELAHRGAELARAAQDAADGAARESYRRAEAALEAQLAHCRTARRGLDRVRARLHEEVAQLEHASSALALLPNGEHGAAELDLLSQELQESAAACELQAGYVDGRRDATR